VRGGVVVEVGGEVGGALPLDGAEPVDLDGGTLLPGFVDAHAHPVFAGNQLRHCDLRDASDAGGYLDLIGDYARQHPDTAWITGGGWALESVPGGTPTRHALDAIEPVRPVYLPNRDAHGAWVNSAALELVGIDRSTPDPPDGRIERDGNGDPIGMLQEGATALVGRVPALV
jgi:predicted amidohydrolase YtcJ